MLTVLNLKHMDRVYVRTNPDFELQQTVQVSGEMQFPGSYTILNSNETLQSIIERTGVNREAYSKGSQLLEIACKL